MTDNQTPSYFPNEGVLNRHQIHNFRKLLFGCIFTPKRPFRKKFKHIYLPRFKDFLYEYTLCKIGIHKKETGIWGGIFCEICGKKLGTIPEVSIDKNKK